MVNFSIPPINIFPDINILKKMSTDGKNKLADGWRKRKLDGRCHSDRSWMSTWKRTVSGTHVGSFVSEFSFFGSAHCPSGPSGHVISLFLPRYTAVSASERPIWDAPLMADKSPKRLDKHCMTPCSFFLLCRCVMFTAGDLYWPRHWRGRRWISCV